MVVVGGRVVVETPPAPGTVVVVDTTVVAVVGSTVVAGTVMVAGTVAAGTVAVGTVVVGTVVDPPEVAVTVGRIVVLGGGAGRVNTSTRSP